MDAKTDRRRATPRAGLPRLDEAQRELASTHFLVALAEAVPFQEHYPALADEIASAALLGLVEAASRFDPSKGVQFWKWAQIIVRFRAIDSVRTRRRARSREELAAEVRAKCPEACALFGMVEGSAPPSAPLDEEDWFAYATAALGDDGRELVDLVYRRGLPLHEAAGRIGRSASAAANLHANCLAAIAGRLKPEGLYRCSS